MKKALNLAINLGAAVWELLQRIGGDKGVRYEDNFGMPVPSQPPLGMPHERGGFNHGALSARVGDDPYH